MIDEIKHLESIARQLELDLAQREVLIEQVMAYSQAYQEGIGAAPANFAFEEGLGLYDSPISEQGIDEAFSRAAYVAAAEVVWRGAVSGRAV